MSDDFTVGQWITLEYPGMKPFNAKVTEVKVENGTITYTMQRHPDESGFVGYYTEGKNTP